MNYSTEPTTPYGTDCKIQSYATQPDGSLRLVFADGQTLTIDHSNQGYESFQIAAPGFMLVV